MLGILSMLLLMFLGKAQDIGNSERSATLWWAFWYLLLFGGVCLFRRGIPDFIPTTVIMTVYAWIFFELLFRTRERGGLWLAIYIVGVAACLAIRPDTLPDWAFFENYFNNL